MSKKMKCLYAFAAIFGILAVVFYVDSIREIDKDAARLLGISAVANIQETVFAAASAVLCGINVIGAMILGTVEGKNMLGQREQNNVAFNTVKQAETEEAAETAETVMEEVPVPKEPVIRPVKDGKCNICGAEVDLNDPAERDYKGQHVYVCEACADLIDTVNDEWISGKKRDIAVSELREKLYSRVAKE